MEACDEEVCTYKRKIHNWLSKVGRDKESETSRRSSKSGSSSKGSSSSSSSRKSRALEEKVRLSELKLEAEFMKKKKQAEMYAEELVLQEKLAKSEAKLRIYEEETIEPKFKLEVDDRPRQIHISHFDERRELRMAKKPLISGETMVNPTLKNDHDITAIEDGYRSASERGSENDYPNSINSNESSKFEDDRNQVILNSSAPEFYPRMESTTNKGVQDNQFMERTSVPRDMGVAEKLNEEMSNQLCKLVRQQAAPEVEIDVFKGDPIQFNYFMSVFREVVEKRIDDPMGRLTRLLKYTEGEPKDLISHCIYLPGETGYKTAIELLRKHYGDPFRLLSSYRKEIKQMVLVKPNDATALRRLYTFLLKCQGIYDVMPNNPLDTPDVVCMLLAKLPTYLQDRWSRKVVKIRKSQSRQPSLKDLIRLVEEELTVISDPLYSREAVNHYKEKSASSEFKVGSKLKTLVTEVKVEKKLTCANCKGNHDIEDCKDYLSGDREERCKKIFRKRLCYGCLKPVSRDHNYASCKHKRKCKICNGGHPTSIHREKTKVQQTEEEKPDVKVSTPEEDVKPKTNCATSCSTSLHEVISMCIVPVIVRNPSSGEIFTTHAMLDSCSQGSFITEELAQMLRAEGRKTDVSIKTINGDSWCKTRAVDGLQVKDMNQATGWIDLPKVYTKNDLPVDEEDIPNHKDLQKWDYLRPVLKELPQIESHRIDLLIGANCPKALEPQGFLCSKNGGPYAMQTALGWCIVGPVKGNPGTQKSINCNRIALVQAGEKDKVCGHHFEIKKEVEETTIKSMLERMYSHDFQEKFDITATMEHGDDSDQLSVEDKRFLHIVESNTKLVEGHYEVPLPFRSDDLKLVDNRKLAERRFENLQRKFSKNADFEKLYFKSMSDMFLKGYAEPCKSNDRVESWYIPHQGVTHPSKPGKVRIVFDCSAEYQGQSINKELLSGPDLTNQIVGILLRFRQEKVALTADIEGMFFQVKLPPQYRRFFKFLWYKDNDKSKPLVDYQMTCHVFGGTSSPSCSNYGLRRTAIDNRSKYGDDAAETLLRSFYVDDLLKSCGNTDEMVDLAIRVKKMCAEGGFRLTKFMSNDMKVLLSIDKSDRKSEMTDAELIQQNLPDEKALGVRWNCEEDMLGFTINLNDRPSTKRGLLSIISSIYDPLGLASPFVLKGRRIFQRLCKLKLGWDDRIPETFQKELDDWKLSLQKIESIKVPRCYKHGEFHDLKHVSLHHFSDASDLGYGTASYLRYVSKTDQVQCALVFAKSRVCPFKFVSIPRMELTAATLAAKLSEMLKKELDVGLNKECFWVDSQVILGYINNEARRFKTFVANRVQKIRDLTAVDKWCHVESGNNPSDLATRGLKYNQTEKIDLWFNGPEFLWKDEKEWPSGKTIELNDDDVEIRKVMVVQTTSQTNELVSVLVEKTTSWMKMSRIVAYVLKFINLVKFKKSKVLQIYFVGYIQKAQSVIIQLVQKQAFKQEIELLESKKSDFSIPASSQLYRLNPFIGENKLIRVGGRLNNSTLPKEEKNPIILPKDHPVSKAIISWCHEMVAHGGRGSTMNKIRHSGYWIVRCNSMVKSTISKCVTCRRLFGKCGEQKMADLPSDRLEEVPPFTFCGVDIFGPFVIKERRSLVKRYGSLFTCLNCRAVHIETVNSMDTDSFILALRRFIGRRGEVRKIRSDNGTNFIGADNELKKALNELDDERIQQYLSKHGTSWVHWKKNPPASSHMGGVWERQIRSARRILSALLKTHGQSLNDESLRTLLVETESIINSRPLTVETIGDPNSLVPLSPSNILTMKSGVVMPPPGNFSTVDMYCRKRWRRVQHIANEFWSRWRKEFLSNLQQRQKWNRNRRNFKVGDIVLLNDDSNRNEWPMAKIMETEPDKYGNVRSVKLALSSAKNKECFRRPITKLVLLLENEEN